MELRHLRYFVAVAEELSFIRASNRLHISQPPLSQQIRNLEAELGLKLFDRTKRRIELTAAGRIFLAESEMILNRAQKAVELAHRASRGEGGQLRIGFMVPQHSRLVGEYYRVFSQVHPSVRLISREYRVLPHAHTSTHLTSRELSLADQLAHIQEDLLDVALVRLPAEEAGITIEAIGAESLMVAMSENHPLATRKEITFRDLREQPYIVRPRYVDPVFHDLVARAFEKADIAPNIAYEQSDLYAALGLVGANLGIAFVPARAQELPISHVVFRRISPPILKLKTGIAYRSADKSLVLSRFLSVVKQVSRQFKRFR